MLAILKNSKRILACASFIGLMIFMLFAFISYAFPAMTGIEAHEKYIYPMVRCNGASGTIIYSYLENQNRGAITYYTSDDPNKPDDKKAGKSPNYSTYILTNYHVIANRIKISEEWDTDLQKNVKKEKRSILYVEIFKYKDLSTPIGTLKVEADVILYDKDEDVALVKLRMEESALYVANLTIHSSYHVMDETVAVGCSLGFPPLPTAGHVTRMNFQVNSLPYHMSSSQTIYGNSGGAMFLAETGELIGIPSMGVVIGWGTPITHMGLFIPVERITKWLKAEHYDFIYDEGKNEKECLELRKKEIEAKKKDKK